MTSWLARITPDHDHPAARTEINDAVRLHKRVMKLFPDDLGPQARAASSVLFRVDDDPRGTSIFVQSSLEPNLSRLPDSYGHSAAGKLDPLLEALRPGFRVNYRLTANAVRRLGPNTRAGKPLSIIPLHDHEAEDWWARKAEEAGLILQTLTAVSLTAACGVRVDRGTGKNQPQRHERTRFDGTAAIADPEKLRTAMSAGIGRGKSYGCGLLTIAPAR